MFALCCSDPFAPVENLFCSLFMGGMWDAMLHAVKPTDGAGADAKLNGQAKTPAKKAGEKKNE